MFGGSDDKTIVAGPRPRPCLKPVTDSFVSPTGLARWSMISSVLGNFLWCHCPSPKAAEYWTIRSSQKVIGVHIPGVVRCQSQSHTRKQSLLHYRLHHSHLIWSLPYPSRDPRASLVPWRQGVRREPVLSVLGSSSATPLWQWRRIPPSYGSSPNILESARVSAGLHCP